MELGTGVPPGGQSIQEVQNHPNTYTRSAQSFRNAHASGRKGAEDRPSQGSEVNGNSQAPSPDGGGPEKTTPIMSHYGVQSTAVTAREEQDHQRPEISSQPGC